MVHVDMQYPRASDPSGRDLEAMLDRAIHDSYSINFASMRLKKHSVVFRFDLFMTVFESDGAVLDYLMLLALFSIGKSKQVYYSYKLNRKSEETTPLLIGLRGFSSVLFCSRIGLDVICYSFITNFLILIYQYVKCFSLNLNLKYCLSTVL